jgi:hypothetical protein
MPEDEFPKALDKGKSQPVNLVFVMQRKGVAFRRFFRCLFEDMFDGETMAMAWVKLAPWVLHRPSDLPHSVALMGVPQVAFRR